MKNLKNLLQSIAAVARFPRRDLVRIAIPVALLALIASVVTAMEKPSGAAPEPAARIDTRVRPQQSEPELTIDLAALTRETSDAPAGAGHQPVRDPFAQRSFSTAQPPAAAAAPAAPTVPALPFRYLGKAIEDGKLSVFLSRGEQSYSVRAGDKLDSEYRVAKVTESSVTFVYLPMKKTQVLDIPAVN
jgi:hypothetical protein